MESNDVELTEEDMKRLEVLKKLDPRVLEFMIENYEKEKQRIEIEAREKWLAKLRTYIPDLEDIPNLQTNELAELYDTLSNARMRTNVAKSVKKRAKEHRKEKTKRKWREVLKNNSVVILASIAAVGVLIFLLKMTMGW